MLLHGHVMHGVLGKSSILNPLPFFPELAESRDSSLCFPLFKVKESHEMTGTFDRVGSKSLRHASKCRVLSKLGS